MARVSTTFGHDDAHSPGGSMNQSRQRRFSPLAITLFCLVGAALIILAGLSALKAMQTANSYAEVVRVENGRTVVLSIDGHEESVQLKGILTPQLPAEGEEPGAANCLAQESTDALTGLLPEGTRVQVEQIDRAAADGPRHAVIRHAGQLVNVQQVSRGLAAPDVGAGVDDGLAEDLRQAQSEARQGARGLYSADVPCSLTAQVTGALAALEGLPEPDPDSVEQADERIEQVRAAVDQGLAAQKTISGIVAAPGSLPALTWADEVPGLRGRIDEALDAARAGLAQLKDARQDLVATQRAAEKAAERERELARQEAARREAAAQAERERERARAAQERAERERAEERRRASQSASASPSETASPSPTESPTPSESPSPEPTSTPEPTPPPTPTSTPTQTPKPTPSTSSEPEPTVTPTPSDAGSAEED